MAPFVRFLLVTALVCGLTTPLPTLAQAACEETCEETSGGEEGNEPSDENGAEPSLVPPRILAFVDAAYPPAAEVDGREAVVELSITIGVRGEVLDAEVVEAQGHGFDEAALEAVRQFRFSPATRDGEAFAVRIRYRYVFELTPPEAVAADIPLPGRLEGHLMSQEDDAPVQGAEVILSSEDQSVARRAVTQEDGAFRFDALPPGSYSLRVIADDLNEITQEEDVRSEEITDVTYRMEPFESDEDDSGAFGARAVIDPPPREVTRRRLPREVLTRIPGTRGDALRAIEILPGVGRPFGSSGVLLIRGSSPGDSGVFVEGAPLPFLYHFGGLTSMINSRLIERIDFMPGNFSVRYGRKMGGIVEVDLRDPAQDGFHGAVEVGVIDMSAMVEFPLGEDASAAVAVRRSLIDLVISEFLSDSTGLVAAPVYYDYQALLTYRPTENDRLRFRFYGANDRFIVSFDDSPGDYPDVRGNAGFSTRTNQLQFSWRHHFSPETVLDVEAMAGLWENESGLGDVAQLETNLWMTSHRVELRHQATESVRLTVGMDTQVAPFTLRYFGPPPGAGDGNPENRMRSIDRVTVNTDVTRLAFRPGLYFESDLRPHERWQIVLGGRVDYEGQTERFTFDPRLSTSLDLGEGFRLKGGIGVFHQPPRFRYSTREIRGNDQLQNEVAIHYGLGAEWDIAPGIRVGVEGFYKTLRDRVVQTPRGNAPFYNNDGIGRVYGLEVSARINPQGRDWFGYLSYTLSRSERQNHPDAEGSAWRPFAYDQTHIFSLSGVYRLGRGWEVGGTLRLVSGNPTTRRLGSVLSLDRTRYTPVFGPTNAERNPLFNRLDLRVEKTWTFDDWKFSLFLDVQNVYNQTNQEGLRYNYDHTQNVAIAGLPILPALGIRGEM